MLIETTVSRTNSWIEAQRISSKSIVLIPTMGALHLGHLKLLEVAKQHGDRIILSLFINPLQFGSKEDLLHYPRAFEKDCELARQAGVDFVFAPSTQEIYGNDPLQGSSTCCLVAGSRSVGLCGNSRPGHFDGVVTVVSILFNIIQPHLAVFGEKDYQQLKVIEQLVKDLHFQVKIISAPIIRDKDGLAFSSRNSRLSAEERFHALYLPRTLFKLQELVTRGERSVGKLKMIALDNLEKSGGLEVDYVEIVDVDTLQPVNEILLAAQVLAAVYVGGVRLIDNVRVEATKALS